VKAVVFLGPTLPADVARRILPHAIFLPPARQGDLLSALGTHEPHVIGLIDGAFGQSLAVWHKEILFALHAGVRVVGAASMGALRAAEMDVFGMEGIGEIYRRFRTGELQDDDEVAVLHAEADLEYRSMSEPMVNIRATLECAHAEGAISEIHADRLVESAKQLHFSERTLPHILMAADLPEEITHRVAAIVRDRYVDLKGADARLLLETLRDTSLQPPPSGMVRSRGFTLLYNEERRILHREVELPLRDIARYAALHTPEFDDLNANALNRALVQILAQLLHADVSEAELETEAARFRRRRGLADEHQVDSWRRAHHLSQAELDVMIHELATCRRLHRWLLGSHDAPQRTRWLLDELRISGRYLDIADEAAQLQSSQSETINLGELKRDELLDLIPAHQRATGWQPTAPIADWAEEAGFTDLKDLAYELLRLSRKRPRQVQ
jgi:hypothetical protein